MIAQDVVIAFSINSIFDAAAAGNKTGPVCKSPILIGKFLMRS